jgi:glycosyltransferase involved in cell wall biosynthesis
MSEPQSGAARPHICVCVCTFRRARFLLDLLHALEQQETAGRFTFSAVVADNDALRSAEATVREFAATSTLPLRYEVEPRQNISLARNLAVSVAEGDFVAFLDDDEVPEPTWLLNLFTTCSRCGVDGVLGPVKPRFVEPPPNWVVAGRFCERPTYPTGFVIDWRKGRTGNVLLKKELFDRLDQPFRPQFRTGEDQDFFRRMIAEGRVFVWCNEAVAYESVPPVRWNRAFMLRRALLRGAVSLDHPTMGAASVAKSAVAAATYAAVLPLSLVLGQRGLMTCLIKLFDHAGRLMASVGINPIKEPYVTG